MTTVSLESEGPGGRLDPEARLADFREEEEGERGMSYRYNMIWLVRCSTPCPMTGGVITNMHNTIM